MKVLNRTKPVYLISAIALVAAISLFIYRISVLRGPDKDCDTEFNCLNLAYDRGCAAATVTTTQRTVEGDPIYTTIKTEKTAARCRLRITIDNSHDRYAGTSNAKQEFTCDGFGGTLDSLPLQQEFVGCDAGHQSFTVPEIE